MALLLGEISVRINLKRQAELSRLFEKMDRP